MSAKLHKKEKRNQRMRAWPVKHETARGLQESQRGKKGTNSRWVGTHSGCYQPQPWTRAPELEPQLESPPATCVPLGKFLCLSSLIWKKTMFSFIYSIGLLWELTDLIQVLRTNSARPRSIQYMSATGGGGNFFFFFNPQWPRGEQFQARSRKKKLQSKGIHSQGNWQ